MSGWRAMLASDLDAMVALAARVHPDHPEDAEVLAERHALYPAGCFVLDGADGIAGYLLSHPWRALDPPPLNRRLGALPAAAGCYYLHDLALHPARRGRGDGGIIVRELGPVFGAWPSVELVAVGGSVGFWGRFGFRVVALAKLDGYGAGARFMVWKR